MYVVIIALNGIESSELFWILCGYCYNSFNNSIRALLIFPQNFLITVNRPSTKFNSLTGNGTICAAITLYKCINGGQSHGYIKTV